MSMYVPICFVSAGCCVWVYYFMPSSAIELRVLQKSGNLTFMPLNLNKAQQNNIGNYAALDEEGQAGCFPYIR